MTRTVELPIWLLILILLFAAVTFASHFLFPSVRWFFRRRAEKLVAKLNERLERPIQPFKLARRHDMIQRLIYDPKVISAAAEHARREGVPENVAVQEARRYAREIVPGFSASAYFGVAIRMARFVSQKLYRVRLGYADEEAIRSIDPEATVVFVMNHRSNMDYVLVTYLAAERSALSYAVGEWAQVWPLRGLIRAMGAYFIRRNSRNTLYRRVLARYVQLATDNGVAQAVFPEGGLSLDGNLREPKLGLLSYILNDFDPENSRDVVFVPVAINYDRVLEDRVLLEAAALGRRKFRFSILRMSGFVIRQIRFMLTGRFHRFGFAAVGFGDPLSLKSFVADGRHHPEEVGSELMVRIGNAVPVLPVPMVAMVLAEADGPLATEEVQKRLALLATRLEGQGAQVHLPGGDPARAAEVGLKMLVLRHMVVEEDNLFGIGEDQRNAILFYAASIMHLNDASAA